MPFRDIPIINKLGLHARAASKFVTVASQFQSRITVVKDGREVSGKSIMGVMMLAAASGSSIQVTAEGSDADEALAALAELAADRFGESQ